jgi:hypothetical protein
MPVIPALRRQEQVNQCKFQATLVYIASSWAAQDPVPEQLFMQTMMVVVCVFNPSPQEVEEENLKFLVILDYT